MMQRSNVSSTRETSVMEPRRRAYQPHRALILAARITLPHFAVSSAMSFLKSAGEPTIAVFA
jgi:hypothetical protein